MIKALANLFRDLHWAIGITAPPPDATPAQELAFVLMWVGIIVFVLASCATMVYLVS